MLHLKHQLQTIAEQELVKLNISGSVVGICFVYDNGCSMIRITFCSDVEPKPISWEICYIEKDIDDNTTWYLYMSIDTSILIN